MTGDAPRQGDWDPELYLAFARMRLRPGLDLLARIETDPARGRFREIWRGLVREAYPPDADGVTPFCFRRLFIVARRG